MNIGKVIGVNANLLTVEFEKPVIQNEVAYVLLPDKEEGGGETILELKAEVIRVRGRHADLQVFEDTRGISVGNKVRFTGELLSVELGPGLIGRVFDGLQNPLPELAEEHGFFLPRGVYPAPLDKTSRWEFIPQAQQGHTVLAGSVLGHVQEGPLTHKIMVPFWLDGKLRLESIVAQGTYALEDTVATVKDEEGREHEVSMLTRWPVKIPITAYAERLRTREPMTTKIRVVDTFCPVALGGVYCIPGPFGAGKTVIQQITSRYADVDIVIIAACGERAGEVVETIRTFPELEDPRTGNSLMDRTLIICNTSSMPVAAREASVYTAVTIAEYYRQMGLNILLLADSTSRWAQALREMSGRLEEIPGEEAFPAYLESVIASFYERGGLVKLHDGATGSVTIGGTVSPAGGNFEEPVTQSTLKVVGAFHGLSRTRSDARRYPAINVLESWSVYQGAIERNKVAKARRLLVQGEDVAQMMRVVGEEGTSMEDFLIYLKSEFLDAVYLQQDAYDPVDGATDAERQRYVFDKMLKVMDTNMQFETRKKARSFFQGLTQLTRDYNRAEFQSERFLAIEEQIRTRIAEVAVYA